MEIKLENKLVAMLRSEDRELQQLAVVLFCSERRTYMEWLWISQRVREGKENIGSNRSLALLEMLQKGVIW
jgi:lauroyl/myristoyl acyltransferase